MTSSIQIHLPLDLSVSKYFAFVALEVDLTKVGKVPYDERIIDCEFTRTIRAGVYGFNNKETRNRFVSSLNGASEIEVAYIASINPATGPVAS